MATITFQAHIMNGMIEIPAMYRDQFPDTIQVLVMATPCPEPTGILDRLLQHPRQNPTFVPLTREEIYADRLTRETS